MVLEISATPYIFTFKMWDWGRLGLDCRPRPIHLKHGLANVQWERGTAWTKRNLVNRIEAPAGVSAGEAHDERAGPSVASRAAGPRMRGRSPDAVSPTTGRLSAWLV